MSYTSTIAIKKRLRPDSSSAFLFFAEDPDAELDDDDEDELFLCTLLTLDVERFWSSKHQKTRKRSNMKSIEGCGVSSSQLASESKNMFEVVKEAWFQGSFSSFSSFCPFSSSCPSCPSFYPSFCPFSCPSETCGKHHSHQKSKTGI